MQFLSSGIDQRNEIDWVSMNLVIEPSNDPTTKEFVRLREKYRNDAFNTIIFVQAKIEHYYNSKHQEMSFKVSDKVYIKLAYGSDPGYYRLPGSNAKLSVRRIGPFPIIEVIGELAYKLQLLPDKWNHIHPVISIAYLEKHIDNMYLREIPLPLDLVEDEDGEHFEYEVESIVAKRYNKRRKKHE